MTRFKTLRPLEEDEQITIFQWARQMEMLFPELELLHAIPNGGRRNVIEATHLKAAGVKKGVPDMHLPVARGGYHGLWIELKRDKKAEIKPEQEKWLAKLTAQGYCARRCDGSNAAIDLILAYLGPPKIR